MKGMIGIQPVRFGSLGVNDSSRFPHGHGAQQSREVRARRSLV
jgi:hypothetical protein